MKKILLSLLLFFGSIISFGNCKNITDIYLTTDSNGNYTYGSNDEIRVYGNSNAPFAYCINPSSTMKVYYVGLSSDVKYISDNTTCFYIPISNAYISLQPLQNTTIYYTAIKLIDFGTYETLENNYNICQSTLNNLMCETHIQFQDISNGVGVKTISSLFSPFSGANNNSVFYNSTENEIQISQYGDAEIISTVEITNCSSCEIDLLNCNSQLSTLSGNYNSCLGELNSCMSNSGSNCSGTGTNWSALYINNIQHLGKPIINIAIPEEINWDYNSTGDLFDLSVVGYNVDYEKIEGIIDIQNIKPTKEDFNKLVSEVVPLLIPGLFIIAFIYFVFRFIKKIF